MTAFTKYEPGQFSWVDLMAADLDEAKRFYGGLFGWTAEDQDTQGGPPYVIFKRGDDQVAGMGLISPEMKEAGVPPLWNNYVTVADVEATLARVTELGGQVTMPAMQVMDAGHMAGLTDPTGAMLFVWQPLEHIGSTVCNEPNTLCWNELATRDIEAARTFYEGLFGWTCEDFPGGPTKYYLHKVGDRHNGGLLAMNDEWGEMPSCWCVYFSVADTDATAAKVAELGGTVTVEPFDIPVGRMAVVADPQGAVFNVITLCDPD